MIPLKSASGRKMLLNKCLICIKVEKKQSKVGRKYQPKKTSVLKDNSAI